MKSYRLLLSVLTVVLAASGCVRSPAYKRDQSLVTRPEPASYYNKKEASKTPAERVESMGQPKKRIVVLDFWNDTPIRAGDIGSFAADEIRRGLYLTQRVVIPPDVKPEHGTEYFVQGENVKVSQLIREGRQMGVSVLVIGRIVRVVFRQKGDDVGLLRQKQSLCAVDVEIKMFDVAGGREILAAGKSGEASNNAMVAFETENIESPEYRAEQAKMAIRSAAVLLVPEVMKGLEKMTWEGRIVKVSGTKVYINAGRASGLVVGDILKVLTQGDDVYDPATGAYLGRSQGQLKGTLEVMDFLGNDGATTEVHTGGNFQEGESVQLY